jgi:hypothetical protein
MSLPSSLARISHRYIEKDCSLWYNIF